MVSALVGIWCLWPGVHLPATLMGCFSKSFQDALPPAASVGLAAERDGLLYMLMTACRDPPPLCSFLTCKKDV